jgi:FkbM family methyltransferase
MIEDNMPNEADRPDAPALIERLSTRWGSMHGFTNDQGVSAALRRFGEYAAAEIDLYSRLAGPGDAVVDVGSNIGVVARALAVSAARPTVIGFEPQPQCFRLASANTFSHGNVSLYPLAAADRAGMVDIDEIDLRRPGNYGGFGLDPDRQSPRRVPCPTVRLDAFLATRAPRPRLVKIDAEGMEAAVLRGMRGLAHDRLVISAEADRRAWCRRSWRKCRPSARPAS